MLMNVQGKFPTYPAVGSVTGSKAASNGGVRGQKEKVQDLLAKRYSNADVFVSSKTEASTLGFSKDYQSDKEYSIILDEDEMDLLASTDPKDRKAQEDLYAQIDSAMEDAEKLGEEVQANQDFGDVLQVGITVGSDGKSYYFAKTESGGFQVDSKESLLNSLLEKVSKAKASAQSAEKTE